MRLSTKDLLNSVKKNVKNLGISMRLHLPMPIVLLFLPCVCGIMFARIESVSLIVVMRELVVFGLGTIIMRSAGCLINEIVDRKIDKLVRRTENRPIASGELSVAVALIAALLLCLLGLVLGVTMLSPFTMKILFVGGLIMFVYPFTKRFMDYPQVVLGLCWNIGVLGGFASITQYVSLSVILLYIAADKSCKWTGFLCLSGK